MEEATKEHHLFATLSLAIPEFRKQIENYTGSAKQLKRVLLKISEHAFEDDDKTILSYPEEKRLFTTLNSIVDAKIALYNILKEKEINHGQ